MASTGLGGRQRARGSSRERPRVAATKALTTAIDRIAAVDQSVGRHLQRTIHTGSSCTYSPTATVLSNGSSIDCHTVLPVDLVPHQVTSEGAPTAQAGPTTTSPPIVEFAEGVRRVIIYLTQSSREPRFARSIRRPVTHRLDQKARPRPIGGPGGWPPRGPDRAGRRCRSDVFRSRRGE